MDTKKSHPSLIEENAEEANFGIRDDGIAKKICSDFQTYWRTIVIVLTPIIFLPLPICSQTSAAKCAYVVLLMAVYWMTEAIPLAITALFPLVLYPPLGVLSAQSVSVQYLKDSNFVFFGSMMMALAVEESQLHRRLAMQVLLRVGASTRQLMLGFMLSTGFLSMWMSNTAATAMMTPLAVAVIHQLDETTVPNDDPQPVSPSETAEISKSLTTISSGIESIGTTDRMTPKTIAGSTETLDQPISRSRISICESPPATLASTSTNARNRKGLLLCICYAANIGGTATLTGTGSNIVLSGQLDTIYLSKDTGVTFASWMAFAVPQAIVMLFFAWIWLQLLFIGFRCTKQSKERDAATKALLKAKMNELGKMSFAELLTSIAFVLLILLWLFRDPGFIPGWNIFFPKGFVSDGTTAMFIGCLLFLLPADKPEFEIFKKRSTIRITSIEKKPRRSLLSWKAMQNKFAWNIVLLLGGGYAMAEGVSKSGLDDWIGQGLSGLRGMPNYAFVAISVIMVTFMTEFSSNVAVASIFIPIGASVADIIQVNPLYVMIPIAVGCSFAFCLPPASPPNAIVFGSGMLRVVDMALAGFFMNVVCIGILLLNMNTYGYWLFDCGTLPSWAVRYTTTIPITNSTVSI